MASQIEMLETAIKEDEARLGPDAPILSHLRTQLASLKRQADLRAGGTPTENPVSFQVGMQG